MCEGFGASLCWDALRAERWPPGEGAERRSWMGSWVCVRWVGAADAKDANKRRPCQEKRCTTVRGCGWVSKRIGDRCSSHCKRLSLSASRAHWPVLSRAALAGEQASFVNVSTGTAFTTTLPHKPAPPRCTAQPPPPEHTHNGYAACCQPAIGRRRRPLDGCARILDHGSAGEGDRGREHRDAQHAGRQLHRLKLAGRRLC